MAWTFPHLVFAVWCCFLWNVLQRIKGGGCWAFPSFFLSLFLSFSFFAPQHESVIFSLWAVCVLWYQHIYFEAKFSWFLPCLPLDHTWLLYDARSVWFFYLHHVSPEMFISSTFCWSKLRVSIPTFMIPMIPQLHHEMLRYKVKTPKFLKKMWSQFMETGLSCTYERYWIYGFGVFLCLMRPLLPPISPDWQDIYRCWHAALSSWTEPVGLTSPLICLTAC